VEARAVEARAVEVRRAAEKAEKDTSGPAASDEASSSDEGSSSDDSSNSDAQTSRGTDASRDGATGWESLNKGEDDTSASDSDTSDFVPAGPGVDEADAVVAETSGDKTGSDGSANDPDQVVPEEDVAAPAKPLYEYLFANHNGWVLSPSTEVKWSWDSFQAVEGTYQYAKGGTRGSFSCVESVEAGVAGAGCSTGAGVSEKALIKSASTLDPVEAEATVCNDKTEALGGACERATVYVRLAADDATSNAGVDAIKWIPSGVCFHGYDVDPVWATSTTSSTTE